MEQQCSAGLAERQVAQLPKDDEFMRSKLAAMRPALPCAFFYSSALTRSTVA